MAEESKDRTARGLLIGFLAGSALGAIIALLYAPKSGKEMRKELKEKASDIKDEVTEKLNLARTKAGEIINDGKRKSDEIISDAKERAGSILTDAEKMLSDAREKAAEETARVKSAYRAGADQYKSEKHS